MYIVVDFRARHDVRGLAERAATGHSGRVQRAVDEPIASVLGVDGQPAMETHGARTFVLEGAFAGGVPAWARDPNAPLEELAQHCADGTYTLFVWDRDEQRLLICPDLLGFRPLVLAERDGVWVLSGHQRAAGVLGSPRIDMAGLATSLQFGTPLGTRTLLDGVRTLPPQCAAVLSAEGLRLLPRPSVQPLETAARGDDLADAGAEALERTARVWLGHGEPSLLALSGGIDSRAMLGAALATGADIVTASWGLPGASDAALARRLARAAGVPHETVEVSTSLRTPAQLAAPARNTETLSAGHLPFYGEPWLAYLAEQGRPVVHGICGDALSGKAQHRSGVPLEMLAGPADAAAAPVRSWASGRASDALLSVVTPELRPLMQAGAGEAYAAQWEATPGDHAFQRLLLMTLTAFDRRRTSLLAVRSIGTVAPVLMPYYTRDYIRFALGLPQEELFQRRLMLRTIARRYPPLAVVPRTGKGRPTYERTGAYGLFDQVRSRLQKRLSPTRTFRPLVREHLPVYAEGLRAGADLLAPFVDVGPICAAWETHDLGGLSESEAFRLFNTTVVLGTLVGIGEPLPVPSY